MKLPKIDWKKNAGLVPAIVQDAATLQVLMLGYMDAAALKKTLRTKKVTFFSRSKQRLWTKGESSKNFLHLVDVKVDCDHDTLLVTARPDGPTCHRGTVRRRRGGPSHTANTFIRRSRTQTMNVFERSWSTTKTSFAVINQDKEMLLFPVVAAILSTIFSIALTPSSTLPTCSLALASILSAVRALS